MRKQLFNLTCFLSLPLLLLGAKAEAQEFPSPATRVPYVSLDGPPNFTRADTARAIRRLYKSRRGGGAGWLALGVSGILASTLPAQQSTSAGVWTPGVVAGSLFTIIGLNKRIQFRPGNERQVLRELAATGRIAPSVARRLRGQSKVVKGLLSDYNPLLAEGIAPTGTHVLAEADRARVVDSSNSKLPFDTTKIQNTPAQQSNASLSSDRVREMAYSDTLRAVSRLFERRRRGGLVWQAFALGGVLTTARTMASSDANTGQLSGGELATMLGIFVAAPVTIGAVNLTAYKKAHQEEVEAVYRAGRPLPKKIRQRLKKKDLQPYD